MFGVENYHSYLIKTLALSPFLIALSLGRNRGLFIACVLSKIDRLLLIKTVQFVLIFYQINVKAEMKKKTLNVEDRFCKKEERKPIFISKLFHT